MTSSRLEQQRVQVGGSWSARAGLVVVLGCSGTAREPEVRASNPVTAPPSQVDPGIAPEPAKDPEPGPTANPRTRGAAAAINERWIRATPSDAAQSLERDGREVFEHRDAVLSALDLQPGTRVADIGAGSGFFAKMMAERVGPGGRVYAVDIAPALIKELNVWARTTNTSHFEAILGSSDDPRLPRQSVDVIFSSDTYHHFENPGAMLRRLRDALRPRGRMYILDFEREPGVSPSWILEHVRTGKSEVIGEVTAEGFDFVREVTIPELRENYLLEFRLSGSETDGDADIDARTLRGDTPAR